MRVSKTVPVKEKTKKVKAMHDDLPIREGEIGVESEDLLNYLFGHDNSGSEFGEWQECSGDEEDVFLWRARNTEQIRRSLTSSLTLWQDLLPSVSGK
ncbi:hypothetical protein PoB_007178800 [Plakobranchus ocellatus]|uniref:Uncharacterized protein n=1 Tax=Plakobranchus ocellatus TaxID=259542 RepID=A0AAV4DLW4_9GAST|nr:hypothetical protein PoB_007178800 [Plakobranchus ocellatus]